MSAAATLISCPYEARRSSTGLQGGLKPDRRQIADIDLAPYVEHELLPRNPLHQAYRRLRMPLILLSPHRLPHLRLAAGAGREEPDVPAYNLEAISRATLAEDDL